MDVHIVVETCGTISTDIRETRHKRVMNSPFLSILRTLSPQELTQFHYLGAWLRAARRAFAVSAC
jgi:hypothetical protein